MVSRVRTAEQVAALDALYAELPPIQCRGLCADSCGRLPLYPVEQERIAREAGVDIPDGRGIPTPAVCPALTMLGRCGVHEIRPMICRIWGLVENLPCEWGCVPDGGRLSVADGYEFLARAAEICGETVIAARLRAPFATPELAAASSREAIRAERDRVLAYQVRESLAIANGTAVFAHGRGRLSKTPPHKTTTP